MPPAPGRSKATSSANVPQAKKKIAAKLNTVKESKIQEKDDINVRKKTVTMEAEPNKDDAEPSSVAVPNLDKFKFQKKPHIKIEFEKDSYVDIKDKTKGLWEPQNWREFLVNLKIMRSNNDAPVDTMGCHMTMDENASPEVMRYQSLIALMLSSQTKDQVTFAAMERLRAKGLTVDNVLSMSDEELGQLIYPVGFWKTKVKYIKKTTQTLKEQYKGDIPDSVEKLCKLTGVGPKMAHICMKVSWNKVTGIGVDTHVHRISNRIGWVKKPTTTPEDTRKALQTWLPFELWSEVNHLMVGFGQTICTPISPICNECLNRDICPSSGKGRKSPLKKSLLKQEIKTEIEDNFEEEFNLIKSDQQNKRKTTPKKDLPVASLDLNKVSPKKKVKMNKNSLHDASSDEMDDFKQPRSSPHSLQVKGKLDNDHVKKSLLIKRKSYRHKHEEEAISDNGKIVEKKKTKAAKKK